MEYGYTQLEGAIGLMPAKLGPNDKTPAYILKRSNFWKVAIASFVLVVGLAGLYFGSSHDLWRTSRQLEHEIRGKRRTESHMSAKLAELELELEKHMRLEERQGILSKWFVDHFSQLEEEYMSQFSKDLDKLTKDEKLSKTQEKEVLGLFASQLKSYTDSANHVAAVVSTKLDAEAKAAKSRLHMLQQDLNNLIALDRQKRDDYMKSEYKHNKDKDGDGYPDETAEEDMHFESEDEREEYAKHMQDMAKIKEHLKKFFSRAELYNKFYFPLGIAKNTKLYDTIVSLHDLADEAESTDDDKKRRQILKRVREGINTVKDDLIKAKVVVFNPSQQTEFGYLSAILMSVNWKKSYEIITKLKSFWEAHREQPLDVIERIEDAIHNNQVPEDLLLEDLTPLVGISTGGHHAYLQEDPENDFLAEEIKSASRSA